MIKKAISLGVSKINVNTECQLSLPTRKYIEAGKDLEGKGFDPASCSPTAPRPSRLPREDRAVRLCQQGLIS